MLANGSALHHPAQALLMLIVHLDDVVTASDAWL